MMFCSVLFCFVLFSTTVFCFVLSVQLISYQSRSMMEDIRCSGLEDSEDEIKMKTKTSEEDSVESKCFESNAFHFSILTIIEMKMKLEMKMKVK